MSEDHGLLIQYTCSVCGAVRDVPRRDRNTGFEGVPWKPDYLKEHCDRCVPPPKPDNRPKRK